MNNVWRLDARFKEIQLSKIRGPTRDLTVYEKKRQNCNRYTENLIRAGTLYTIRAYAY